MRSYPIAASLTLLWTDRYRSSVWVPAHAIAWAVLPPWRDEDPVEVVACVRPDDGEFSLVFCMKTPKDRGGLDALLRARKECPLAKWRTLSGISCGLVPGVEIPYWAMTVTCSGEKRTLDRGGPIASLDGLLARMSESPLSSGPKAAS